MIKQKEAPADEGRGSQSQTIQQGEAIRNGGARKEENRIDGAQLLDDLVALFRRHLSLPEGAAEVMALWVVFAHCFGSFDALPRLAFVSPLPDCGKTTALTLLNGLVPRPLPTSNVTPAFIYRAIDQAIKNGGCTVMIDEADTFMNPRDALAGILNSGHTRATAFASRCVGDMYEPRQFSTWAPIVVAMIGSLPPALKSRSIVINMRHAKSEENIERVTQALERDLATLRAQLERWADLHRDELRVADPLLPEGFRNRLADNFRPLLAIADAAGGAWPVRARAAAVGLSGEAEPPEAIRLLSDVRDVFAAKAVPNLASKDLVVALNELGDEGCWTQRELARALKPFHIGPHSVRIDRRTPKGYSLKDFEDAFTRYLVP